MTGSISKVGSADSIGSIFLYQSRFIFVCSSKANDISELFCRFLTRLA